MKTLGAVTRTTGKRSGLAMTVGPIEKSKYREQSGSTLPNEPVVIATAPNL